MDDRIIIIDGNSLINRAYYAMQRPMITKDGLYTQGIYGFLNMLEKIKKDHPAGYIAVAFDLKAPTFRHKEYDQYKAGRKKMPPELAMQLPVLRELLDAMKIKRLSMEGYEADDIIGTVARVAEEEGLSPLIITGDKDELQLATEKTKVLITKKGISQFALYDHDAFVEEYGFTPTQFIDYKGLMGDTSDNIPGLPGIGPKTAGKWIQAYGSVEGLLDHADDLKGKQKETVEDNGSLALMSKKLATIDTHVPLEMDLTEFKWEEPDRDALIELYKKLEFNSFLRRMDKDADGAEESDATGKTGKEKTGTETGDISIETITDPKNLAQVKKVLKKEGAEVVLKVFGDGNHKDRPRISGVALLIGDRLFYLDTVDSSAASSPEEDPLIAALINLLNETKPSYIGHDLKDDYYMLMTAGLSDPVIAFDTAVAQYVLDPGRSNYDLAALAKEYYHEDLDDVAERGLAWCALVRRLAEDQKEAIEKEDLAQVMDQAELPLVSVMSAMEKEGFAVDPAELSRIGDGIRGRVEELTKAIHDLAGEEFNINSPKQLGPILFEKLGLPAGKKTKTGYSTSAKVLENLAGEHEIIPLILEYRQLTKLMGTYIDGLIPMIHADGKIHARFNQTVTATGRISSSDPNLQNIPIRQELGRTIRRAFIPDDEDHILMGADYSQIELRVLAHVSGDEALIKAFRDGEDIHRATAARVLQIPEEEITSQQRSRAKAINFGVIYGMSGFGLATNLHITRREAEDYIASYFAKHQAVKEYMDQQVAKAKEDGYVTTMLGRKRRIPEIGASNFMVRQAGERLAMNSPIQGSAADIIKIAMIRVYDALREYRSRLILQVHDELIIQVVKEEEEAVRKILTESMENAVSLQVPLVVDLHTGDNWYDLK